MIDVSGPSLKESYLYGSGRLFNQVTITITVTHDEANPKSFMEKEEFLTRLKKLCEEY